MKFITLILFVVLSINAGFSQTGEGIAISYSNCYGSLNIFESGNFKLQFTGEKQAQGQFGAYPHIKDFPSANMIWCTYIPPADGTIGFEGKVNQGTLQMVIFEEISDVCQEILDGTCEIKRLVYKNPSSSVGLRKEIDKAHLYTLDVVAGKKYQICFSTEERSTELMTLDFKFAAREAAEERSEKVLDLRDDDFAPTLTIVVKDNETELPIVANLTVEGMRELDAHYKASELYLSIPRSGKIQIRCDAEGYFFIDKELDLDLSKPMDVSLMMDPVKKGKSIQIQEIEFKPGTSEFLPGTEPRLKRLKDFLALNSDLEVEIQGHVYSPGENSILGQRISEARAKRVMNYLIHNGIDRSRLSAEGYGNTRPIYPNPKFSYEEQANRRVEIVVK